MNKDIVRKISETSTPASLEDIKYMREIVKNTAEYYATRLVDYLCNNNHLFPEYTTNSNGDLAPTKDTYFSGIVLDQYEQSNRITLRSFLDASYDI